MEIQLTPDQEEHLAALAARAGRSPDELAQEAVNRFLNEEAHFAEVVKLGIAAADRGEFVAAEEVWEGVERILRS
jgi:predicted transcriptional regulator